MRLNLSEIIEVPGSIAFECTLDNENLLCPSINSFTSPVTAKGAVTNSAGALTLSGKITAPMELLCDRCLQSFDSVKIQEFSVPLADELIDEDNPDIFLLDGDYLKLSETLETIFILDMETKFLCTEDCAGLCSKCGADLNKGPCDCKKDVDPRLAVLSQLLDDKDSDI